MAADISYMAVTWILPHSLGSEGEAGLSIIMCLATEAMHIDSRVTRVADFVMAYFFLIKLSLIPLRTTAVPMRSCFARFDIERPSPEVCYACDVRLNCLIVAVSCLHVLLSDSVGGTKVL